MDDPSLSVKQQAEAFADEREWRLVAGPFLGEREGWFAFFRDNFGHRQTVYFGHPIP